MARKKKKDDEKASIEYMLTYGDMVTLLLCFFVLLISMATFDKVKLRIVLSSFRGAFSIFEQGPSMKKEELMNMGRGVGKIVRGTPLFAPGREARRGRKEKKEGIHEKMKTALEEGISRGYAQLRKEEEGIAISLIADAFFKPNTFEITSKGKDILDKVIMLLEVIPNQIKIEGHTDNSPIRMPHISSNWELSVLRATAVLKYLEASNRIASTRLSAGGYGEYRPLVPNDTPEHKRINGRANIIVLREELSED